MSVITKTRIVNTGWFLIAAIDMLVLASLCIDHGKPFIDFIWWATG